jgi:hypothetical protein
VLEAESGAPLGRQAAPVAETLLQQHKGAHHVGLHELPRTINGAINMAFCRKMHDHIRLEPLDDGPHPSPIRNVAAGKGVAGAVGGRGQRIEVSGVGEFVDHQNLMGRVSDQATDDSRSNKAGTSSYKITSRHVPIFVTL